MSTPNVTLRDRWKTWIVWGLLALLSEAIYLCISKLSSQFVYGVGHRERPIFLAVEFFWVASILYLLSCLLAWRWRTPPIWFVVVASLVFRLTVISSNPVQEDDYYRYLWDGKVTAAGLDPFRFSPKEIKDFAAASDRLSSEEHDVFERYLALRDASSANAVILDRVNHPKFSTVYPLGAQMVFLPVGALIPDGWSVPSQVIALKGWMTMFDFGTLLVLVALLRSTGLPGGFALAYGWCPLVVKEFANSGHVDAAAGLFLLLSVLLALRGSWLLTGTSLAFSILVKLYSVAALPFVLLLLARSALPFRRPPGDSLQVSQAPQARGRQLVRPALAGAVTAGWLGLSLLAYPESSGRRIATLKDFLTTWENYDAVFIWIKQSTAFLMGQGLAAVDLQARWAVVVLFCLIAGWNFIRELRRGSRPPVRPESGSAIPADGRAGPEETLGTLFAVLAAAFLLSPVAFPWYFSWCLPLLPYARRWSYFLLPGLLMTYYLRFWFIYHLPGSYRGYSKGVDYFDEWIVPLVYSVFFVAWAVETAWAHRKWGRARGRSRF